MAVSYKKLWKRFLKEEAGAFVQERKLPIKEIKRIGIKKFIAANDWKRYEDISKWRTDVLKVIPCPHCNSEFGVLDDTLGLCEKCCPRFDLAKFYKDIEELSKGNLVLAGQIMALFMIDNDVRQIYVKKEVTNGIQSNQPNGT